VENGREYILHTKSFFHLKLLLPHDDRRKKRKNRANDVDATVYLQDKNVKASREKAIYCHPNGKRIRQSRL
jgi:hypothetical protein